MRRKSAFDNRLSPLPRLINRLFLAAVFLVMFIPMWNVAVLSTSTELSASAYGVRLWWSAPPSLEGYAYVFRVVNLLRPVLNSLFVSVVSTAVQVVLSSLAGYILIQREMPFQKSLTSFVFLTMMVPGDLTLVSLYQLNKRLYLVNTYAGLIVNGLVSGFCILLMRNYFLSVPASLAESARIDSAGEFLIFWKIYLPLSVAGLATTFFLQFVGKWNELMLPASLISDQKLYTLPLVLKSMVMDSSSTSGTIPVPENAVMATVVISSLPLLLLYTFAQRYLLEGMTLGADKG